MTRSHRLAIVALGCAVASAVFATATGLAQAPSVGASAEVRDAAGRLVATAEFREGRGEVLIILLFPNPPVLSGTHAVHINEVGRCDPPDFASSGSIFNPFNKKHGRQNPEGAEVGDLANINFTTGLTNYNTTAPGATLGKDTGSLLGPNRTALVILAGEDDQKTPPEGNAGARIACGVITPAAGAPSASVAQVAPPQPTATPTPASAPAVPRIASPVPAQAAQPAPGQPAAKPANSPIVVQPPAVVKAVSPSAVAAQSIPTPIVAPTAPPLAVAAPQTSSGLSSVTALIIAVLGVGLVGAGYLLRRRSQLQRRGN